MRLITLLATLVVTIALTLPAAAAGPTGRKACFKNCGEARRTCLRVAKQRRAAAQASCTPDAGSRRACRRAAGALLRKAKPACGRYQRQCRACCRAGGNGPACPIGRPVDFEAPPMPDLERLGVPRLPNGRYLAIAIPGLQLEIDPTRRDPVTAFGACLRWITKCVEPGVRQLDDCARSVPSCLTDRPWEERQACCPTACFAAYEATRQAGTPPLPAFQGVYLADAGCFPGLRELGLR